MNKTPQSLNEAIAPVGCGTATGHEALESTAQGKSLSVSMILGLNVEGSVDGWADVLSSPGLYDESAGSIRPAKSIPTSTEHWVKFIMGEHDVNVRRLYLDQPPKDQAALLAKLGQSQVMGLVLGKALEDVLNGLDRIVPSWTSLPTFYLIIFSNEGTKAFDWVTRVHPEILRDRVGIIPSSDNDGTWQVNQEPRLPKTDGRKQDNVLEAIGQRGDGENGSLRITTGAERLYEIFAHVGSDASGWLWTHVVELRSYAMGNDKPWRTATELSSCHAGPQGHLALGELYLNQAASAIQDKGILVGDHPEEYVAYARNWLSVPLMSNADTHRRLVNQDIDLRDVPGLSRRNMEVVDALLGDAGCAPGYVRLLNKVGMGTRSWGKRTPEAYEPLGYVKADFETQPDGTGGLIQAAMMMGNGAVLQRLFQNTKGVKLVQKILSGPMGPRCLSRMGESACWSALGDLILARPNDWRNWRDSRGNTITHWLSYGGNTVDGIQEIRTNMELARAFPEHMSVSNNLGNEPVVWMARKQADIIARQRLRKAAADVKTDPTEVRTPRHKRKI